MEQEKLFQEYYSGLSPEDIEEEINTLANIRLSVDFYEYLSTDPEKLLAIIHYNDLEEKYGIRIIFDTENKNSKETFLTDHTGNMSIVFRFNNDVYRISTMIDSVSNNSIYDSFVEQIMFLLNNHKSEIISQEENVLKKYEKDIQDKFNASSNLMWYIMNSPKNIKEMLEKINKSNTENFEECVSDHEEVIESEEEVENNSDQDQCSCEQCEQCSCEECEECEHSQKRDIICPLLTVCISIMSGIFIRCMEVVINNQ